MLTALEQQGVAGDCEFVEESQRRDRGDYVRQDGMLWHGQMLFKA